MKEKYIIVTGAAGFIGSCLVSKLNSMGLSNLILVDDFLKEDKTRNLEEKKFIDKIHRTLFFDWIISNTENIEFIFHIGARADTTETNKEVFDELNLNYSKKIWNICTKNNIPIIYISSAATYGSGEFGYEDSNDIIESLNPLNLYGESKNDFDKWVLKQEKPPFWIGLKFFNVYGPNEYHKNRMSSVILKAYNQIKETGKMQLFKSHNSEYKDGEQLRDFIYVKDILEVLIFLYHHRKDSGIYNLGTGKARTFMDLVTAVFTAMGIQPEISFIGMPEDIRSKYQYFTEASMGKLRSIGFTRDFYSLEEGVSDYVKNYLIQNKTF